MNDTRLEIRNLHVSVEDKQIVKGVNLIVRAGEIHALMGPNGSGKSTLSNAIMGHPKYKITEGEVLFNNKNVLEMAPDQRAKLGLFLSFQYPSEISGVRFTSFLRTAYNSVNEKKISVIDFQKLLKEKMALLNIPDSFTDRYLNEGFSGGEKKRAEILQLSILGPKIAILDETDSGLDVSSIKVVFDTIGRIHKSSSLGTLIITHYSRILDYIKPDFVHIMKDGVLVKSGDIKLAKEIDSDGYEDIGT